MWARSIHRAVYAAALLGPGLLAQFSQPFQEGCCLNTNFPRPERVSQATIPAPRLREALNCASNNRFVGGTHKLARALGTSGSLKVAYYYGRYMPEQNGEALTIAAYSRDGRHGVLFDFGDIGNTYTVMNLPPLLRSPKQWRVGEVNGGLWTYTRLSYLAQEIGARSRQTISVSQIVRSKPQSCWVFFEDETAWKPGAGKVGDSVRQATPQK